MEAQPPSGPLPRASRRRAKREKNAMKVGLFTVLFAKLSLDDVIKKIKPLGIRTMELGTGNYPGDPHVKLDWLNQSAKLKEFKQKLDDQGMSISALSCHGNVVHPNKEFAQNS